MNTYILLDAFHGTDLSNAESIMKSGFKCRPNNIIGLVMVYTFIWIIL